MPITKKLGKEEERTRNRYHKPVEPELTAEENEGMKAYHIPACNKFQRRAARTVVYGANNTTKHELAKATGALMLHKWGDIKFNDSIIKALTELSDAVDICFKGCPKSQKAFISEAVPNTDESRRVDIVRLADDYRFEFETDHKERKDIKREKTITIPI